MKRREWSSIARTTGFAAALAGAIAVSFAQDQTPAPPAAAVLPPLPEGTTADIASYGELTVITSDRLLYDGLNGFAELEGNVVVSDPNLKMKADKVRIEMTGTNEVRMIVATGRVVLTQKDKHAWAGRATYDVSEGRFVLEEDPRVLRGRDMMLGDKITFWRNEERIECFPSARLIIYPDPQGRSGLMGGR